MLSGCIDMPENSKIKDLEIAKVLFLLSKIPPPLTPRKAKLSAILCYFLLKKVAGVWGRSPRSLALSCGCGRSPRFFGFTRVWGRSPQGFIFGSRGRRFGLGGEHVFYENAVALGGVLNEHMGNSSDDFSVLYDGTAAHALHDTVGSV